MPCAGDCAGTEAISDQAIRVRLAEDIARASSNSPVAPLSHQSSTDSASGPAGSGKDDLPEPDLAAADQTHAQVHDLSAGGVSIAAGGLSASQSSSSADGGDAANNEEDVLPEVQPAAAQSDAAAGVDPLSPENAVDAVETMPGMLDAYNAWQEKRERVSPAIPGFSGFQLVVAVPQAAVQQAQPAAMQSGHLNGKAAPFVPCLAHAKQLRQEEGGMKEGAGLFGKQGAGLLQQQQASSPKIAAVKVNVLSVLCNNFGC